jgi:acyl carrier protein
MTWPHCPILSATARRPHDGADGTVNGSHEQRVDRILAVVREILSRPDLTADDEVKDHGGTSLSIVRILAVTSRTLDLDIDPRDLDGAVTARSLARVARRPPPGGTPWTF